MNPGEVSSQEQSQTQITEQHIQQLFTKHDNEPVFDEIMDVAGDEYLTELTAAYFLRAHFTNGAGPPSDLPIDHPLYQKIMNLDVESLDDPVKKHVFGLLKGSLMASEQYPEMAGAIDRMSLSAMLVPGLIDKHGYKTSGDIFDVFKNRMRSGNNSVNPEIYAETLLAIGRKVVSDPESSEPKVAFEQFRLVTQSALEARDYANSEHRSIYPTQKEEIITFADGLEELADSILSDRFGIDEGAAAVLKEYIVEDRFSVFGADGTVQTDADLQSFALSLSNPNIRSAINDVAPKYEGFNLKKALITDSLTPEVDKEKLGAWAEALSRDEVFETWKSIGSEQAAGAMISRMMSGSEAPMEYFYDLKAAMGNPRISKLLTKPLDPSQDYGQTEWPTLSQGIITNPKLSQLLFEAIERNGLGEKLLDNMSEALPVFLKEFNYIDDPNLIDLVMKGGSSIIADAYSQASKLNDRNQIDLYLKRVSSLIKDIKDIMQSTEVTAQYKQSLDVDQNKSSKAQARAARIFKSAVIFGPIEFDGTETLDEVENKVVDRFLAQLIGEDFHMSDEERQTLIDTFDGVSALLTYAHKHINNPEWKEAIGQLTRSVASGEYSTWKRGDGSPEALEAMKQAGYLPSNLTLDQYREWINDGQNSSEEELISTAEDTAKAIRDGVAQASVDLDILAPGYTIDLNSLNEIIESRNGLGRLTGLLHKSIKQAEGNDLGLDAIDGLKQSLGDFADSTEVRNLLDLLSNGTDPNEVAKYLATSRGHLEQLRLIIRLANISAEEIAAGSLLSDADEDSKRKPQEKLADVLSQLNTELPDELKFIPETVGRLLADHTSEHGSAEILKVEDTIDPKVTLEIGETPQRSCQHYETGSHNQGLIGYFGPEVKIAIVRNAKGGIIARVIIRLMEDENGTPVLYSEPIYQSVTSAKVGEMIGTHLNYKANKMGIEHRGLFAGANDERKLIRTRALKMPAVYSDAAGGVLRNSMTINA